MGYKSLRACLLDLEQHGHLKRIKIEVDPNLEMAEIHRRVYEAGGPALWFENVKGSKFSAASNIYGTHERCDFLFRNEMKQVEKIVALKSDISNFLKKPLDYLGSPFYSFNALPMRSWGSTPVEYGETTIDQLPLVKSWPMDGGAFVTLPQVLTMPLGSTNIMDSNIGMYRIQLNGNEYITNKEVGLHYQIHRGIGVHHEAYNKSDVPFRCSIFVGGPPSHALSAIFPLPEGMSEMTFAGLLNNRRFRYKNKNGHIISSDADFVITGTIRKQDKKPEGPFGDHLGYYSLQHDFPVMDIEKVYHRKDAIWHFTVVGRPPAEDSGFGYLIHKIVKPLAPKEFPGLVELHAVDAAGVHPLLLGIGKERYMPFRDKKPEEILTIANRILGSGQTSLAKYLWIGAEDNGTFNTNDIKGFFDHILQRVDFQRDLHFQTKTTIDTLDYSGTGLNEGSKLVIAACGAPIRNLSNQLQDGFTLPQEFENPIFFQQGILIIQAPKYNTKDSKTTMLMFCEKMKKYNWKSIPLVILCDDSAFTAANVNNFVWVTFTRSNPSHDVYGIGETYENKHWGCDTMVIDARIKKHHAPVLEVDKKTKEKVDKILSEIRI
jgi:4-hydroxy-3-polyprenylbenzoate decarboxylase